MHGMFQHHMKDGIGRAIPKPENTTPSDDLELYEDAVPITQQIENLRTKITLQERYNTALKDNLEESSQGGYAALLNMFSQVYSLRLDLKSAVNKEKWSINNALRTHRLFQLALAKSTPFAAMDWIDDKLFENAKILNEHIDRLLKKRKKLESVEVSVTLLEKWPVPGSLPWEIKLEEKLKRVCVAQSNTKLKLECAKMFHLKYVTILEKLQEEQTLYAPIVRNLTSQLTFQQSELKNLQQMLGDAQNFQRNAEETLLWTEKEASASRKHRRAQVAKMRKEMQRIVYEEQLSLQGKLEYTSGQHNRGSMTTVAVNADAHKVSFDESAQDQDHQHHHHTHQKPTVFGYQSALQIEEEEALQNERLAQKRAEIDLFNDNAALLVDIMKIPNLTHIPSRLETVLQLNQTMKTELKAKEKLKNTLIKQKDQLAQLFCVIRYTGNSKFEDFNTVITDYEKTLHEIETSITNMGETLNYDSSLIADIQTGVATILSRLEGLDKKALLHIKNSEHLLETMPLVYEKLEELMESLRSLREEVGQDASLKKGHFSLGTSSRFVRVGDNTVEAEGSDEEEFDDYKVPGRKEIKHQSAKLVEQYLLRLGLQRDGGHGRSHHIGINGSPSHHHHQSQ